MPRGIKSKKLPAEAADELMSGTVLLGCAIRDTIADKDIDEQQLQIRHPGAPLALVRGRMPPGDFLRNVLLEALRAEKGETALDKLRPAS